MNQPLQTMPWQPLPAAFRNLAARHPGSVLLETGLQNGSDDKSLLFLHPIAELIAYTATDMETLLRDVDEYLAAGHHIAGYFHYACGDGFLGLAPDLRSRTAEPIAWLGVFNAPVVFHHGEGTLSGKLPATVPATDQPATIASDGLQITETDYRSRIDRVQAYLRAGHSYQVNFTDRITGSFTSTPLALYEHLLRQQPVAFAAYVHAPTGTTLSFSPELFYRTAHGRITVRPMKGTWPRGVNLEGDREAAQQLIHDDKNRAEHVTIVDLLRNDLGRICAPGSVSVDDLFHVDVTTRSSR